MAEIFPIPEFLQNCDVDTLHKKMLDMLPADIDRTEGGFVWDLTRPTALIAAELLQFYLVEAIKLMFPQWSYSEYLDYLAARAFISRKAATSSTATLTITGVPGTMIPKGTVFATPARSGRVSVEFTADRLFTIDENGDCVVEVTASSAGAKGNVKENTITMMASPLNGVETITNESAAVGGTDRESDDSLRERIEESEKGNDQSFIGNDTDYKRWAESVDGVGSAKVMATWDGPGSVKIVCTDANGDPAASTILDDVYDYIMRPDEPVARLAPPDVVLTVVAPTLVTIDYDADIVLEDGYDLATVNQSFSAALDAYYKKAAGDIRYGRIAAILAGIDGVFDFSGLLINGEEEGVILEDDEYPATGSLPGE